VLRRIFEPEEKELTEDGEDYIMRSFINCTLRQMFRVITSRRMRCVSHVARMGKIINTYTILV
jgi:hypothetical protein